MKLAVLTSGGDSAGMNAVVRAVVKAGILKCVVSFSYHPASRDTYIYVCALTHMQGMRDMDRT